MATIPSNVVFFIRSTIFFILLFCKIQLPAQQPTGKLTGVVKTAGKPLDAATVSLLRGADSSLIKIAIADEMGAYSFDKIGYGIYLIKVEAVGYATAPGERIEINASNTSVLVKEISLQVASKTLNTVTVTGSRSLIENRIDKTIVNVDASPTNAGLSALEVLEKSPGVTVDNNGNISLKGKQGVMILIDDKPAYLSGNDLTNYLKSLSSNQLDQIEIMTQPSARYDASGNSGIINIKTKKNRNVGLNGTVSTSAIFANYFKNTNSINFNWRSGKLNFYGNAGYSRWDDFEDLLLNRSSRVDKTMAFERYVEQHNYGRYSGRPQNIKAGIDWFASKKTIIGVAVNRNVEDDKFTSSSHSNIFDASHKLAQYNVAQSETHNPWTNYGFNLNVEQKLDTSGSQITAGADYILFRTKGRQYSYNYLYEVDDTPSEDPYLLQGYLPADIDIFSFKSDYKKPFKNKITLEAGMKSNFVKSDNDAQYIRYNTPDQKWEIDTSRSNHFIYKENINAAYINLQKQIKKWGLQVGLRGEQTIADGNQVSRNISFHKNYTKLFPTTYINYKLNDTNTVAISYGRRIERPGYQ
ncbi:MAG: outer membrane beta-barrel protein [Chitinophagaceae bacterium]